MHEHNPRAYHFTLSTSHGAAPLLTSDDGELSGADGAGHQKSDPLPWIRVAEPGVPYFMTETGAAWTPIGQNDAISWDEFAGLFRRRDLPGVEAHLRRLADHGVTCLRLMLEYAQVRHR